MVENVTLLKFHMMVTAVALKYPIVGMEVLAWWTINLNKIKLLHLELA